MKLLILLVTLLVLLANPSLSKPTPNFNFKEIKNNLREMQDAIDGLKKHELEHLKAISHTVKFQTPRDVKNACECGAPFVQHLKDALMLVIEVLPLDEIANILDSLSDIPLLNVKKPSDKCHFRTHKLRDTSFKDDLIKDNIDFIENWNANCI